jgi:hypothetical protein
MKVAPLAALAAAILTLAPAAPAWASGLPPLGLRGGQGTFGIGAVQVAGDLAVRDGLTLGLAACTTPYFTSYGARAAITMAEGAHGAWGWLAAATLVPGSYFLPAQYALTVGPAVDWPLGPLRVRAHLGAGLVRQHVADWGPYAPYTAGSTPFGWRENYGLGVYPMIEAIVPIGANAELAFFGNQLVGLYGRW